jgi:phage terminase small subunit
MIAPDDHGHEVCTSALTPKQERFVQAYIETGNATEAYRRAYRSDSMKPATVNREAKALLDNPKIAARLDEIRAMHLERHNLTIDDISRMLQEDRALARRLENPAAAVSATMGLAKLYGHLTNNGQHPATMVITVSPEDARL